jgi:hypothetical protein
MYDITSNRLWKNQQLHTKFGDLHCMIDERPFVDTPVWFRFVMLSGMAVKGVNDALEFY